MTNNLKNTIYILINLHKTIIYKEIEWYYDEMNRIYLYLVEYSLDNMKIAK